MIERGATLHIERGVVREFPIPTKRVPKRKRAVHLCNGEKWLNARAIAAAAAAAVVEFVRRASRGHTQSQSSRLALVRSHSELRAHCAVCNTATNLTCPPPLLLCPLCAAVPLGAGNSSLVARHSPLAAPVAPVCLQVSSGGRNSARVANSELSSARPNRLIARDTRVMR